MDLVLSFPKSGRTWVRLFLGIYAEIAKIDLPHIVWAHEEWKSDRRLLLLRDYPDLLVSYYFQKTAREGVDMDIHTFIRHPLFGVRAVNECYSQWLAYEGDQKTIHYEDLFSGIWSDILAYFDIPIVETAVDWASQLSEFDNAKKHIGQLKNRPDGWRFMAMENGKPVDHPQNPEAHKFRRGKVGGYVDYLAPEDINYIQENRLI